MSIPVNISTEPLSKMITNLRTRNLVVTHTGRLEIRRSLTERLFSLLFVLIGAGITAWGVSIFAKSTLDGTILSGFGIVFFLVGTYLLLKKGQKINFDQLRGYFWFGTKDPDLRVDPSGIKKFVRFDEIAGLQMLRKKGIDGNKREYYCAEVNLVLKDGSREHLYVSGDVEFTEQQVKEISAYIRRPILGSPLATEQATDLGSFDLASDPDSAATVDTVNKEVNSPPKAKGKRLITGLFALIFVLIGGFFLYEGTVEFIESTESAHWPIAQGVVENSTVERYKGSSGSPRRTGNRKPTYGVRIDYRYQVNGVEYSSNRYSISSTSSQDQEKYLKIVEEYPRGKQIDVYYNPESPERAVLIPGSTSANWFKPVFSLFFIGIGGLVWYIRRLSLKRT